MTRAKNGSVTADVLWAIAAGTRQFLARRIRRSLCLGPVPAVEVNNHYGTHFNNLVADKWTVIVERAYSLYESPHAVLVFNTDELIVCYNPVHNKTNTLRPQVDVEHPNGVLSKRWSGTFGTWWAVNYCVPDMWELIVVKIGQSQNAISEQFTERNLKYF